MGATAARAPSQPRDGAQVGSVARLRAQSVVDGSSGPNRSLRATLLAEVGRIVAATKELAGAEPTRPAARPSAFDGFSRAAAEPGASARRPRPTGIRVRRYEVCHPGRSSTKTTRSSAGPRAPVVGCSAGQPRRRWTGSASAATTSRSSSLTAAAGPSWSKGRRDRRERSRALKLAPRTFAADRSTSSGC